MSNKQDLINTLRKEVNECFNHQTGKLSQKGAAMVLDAMLEKIKASLENGEDVLVSNFGRFTTYTREDVTLPHNDPFKRDRGETVTIKGGRYGKFIPGGELKNRIKEGYSKEEKQ